ncbi:hypothetical protein BH11BAC1_BH11BAC1_30120 [soil metagenome]
MHQLTAPLSTYSDWLNYFENLAESSKTISHEPENEKQQRFYTDWEALKGQNVSGVLMLLLWQNAGYHEGKSDNQHFLPKVEVTILKAVGNNGEKELREAMDICLAETKRIHKRMYEDSRAGKDPRLFTFFRLDQITIQILDDPKNNDGWAGVASSIPIGNPENMVYDEDETDNWRF